MIKRNTKYKRIFGLLKEIRQTNDWLHQMLPEWYEGKTSLRDLSDYNLSDLIQKLEKIKVDSYVRGNRTAKQVRKIGVMQSILKMKDEALSNFIKRTTGEKNNVDDLNISEASAVITGLMKLKIK